MTVDSAEYIKLNKKEGWNAWRQNFKIKYLQG